MKITYIKLKNFASIFAGMKRKELEIDFSKSKNRITILSGPNATGKTSLLSLLQPFATQGNLDIRSTTNLILEGEPGYKELHIQRDSDKIIIKHHYLISTGGVRSIKSYFSVNDKELNENGNVTSFKSLVEEILGLDQSYLKLSRLGSNVKGIVEMKSTERKEFTAKMLSELEVFAKYHKKISTDARMLQGILNNLSTRLTKMNISDKSDIEHEIERKKLDIEVVTSNLEKIIKESSSNTTKMNILLPNGLYESHKELERIINEIESIDTLIDNTEKLFKKSNLEPLEIPNILLENKTKLSNIINNRNILKEKIESLNTQLNYMYETSDSKRVYLSKISNDRNIDDIEILISNIEQGINRVNSMNIERPEFSRERYLNIFASLQQIEDVTKDMGFTPSEILSYINMSDENIYAKTGREISRLESRLDSIRRMIIGQEERSKIKDSSIYVFEHPSEFCNENCGYIRFYNSRKFNKSVSKLEELEAESNEISKEIRLYKSIRDLDDFVKSIKVILNVNKGNLKAINMNITLKSILENIAYGNPIIDYRNINNMIEISEMYEEYDKKLLQLEDLKRESEYILLNKHAIEATVKEISDIEDRIDTMRIESTTIENEIELLNTTEDEICKFVDTLEYLNENYDKIKDYQNDRNELDSQAKSIRINIDEVEEITSKNSLLFLSEGKRREDIARLRSELSLLEMKLKEFESIKNEQSELEDKYDDINIIRESLSTNKGLPLLFMQVYLTKTQMITNRILDAAYGGDLNVGKFLINDKEFKIPYQRNNIEVEDIIYSSQGETSFISIALSFALIEQSMSDYNILLLDEIDATLDTKNRESFISVLESQLDMLGVEQVFMITHNNMFDQYPVDLIFTGEAILDNYNNSNILFINN